MTKAFLTTLVCLFAFLTGHPASARPRLPTSEAVRLTSPQARAFTAETQRWLKSTYFFDSAIYGAFSRAGVREALLVLYKQATDSGATAAILLRKDGAKWRAVHFLKGGVRQTALTFKTSDGRDLVVSYGEGFETTTFDLRVTRVEEDTITPSLLLDYKNPFPSCGNPPAAGAEFARVVDWAKEDADADGLLDLVLEVATVPVDDFPCDARAAFTQATHQPQRTERVPFLFDGQTFSPSPEAERLMRFSQVPQGQASD